MAATTSYLYLESGAQKGPVTEAALLGLMHKSDALHGQMETLMVWSTGMTEWVAAASVPSLREAAVVMSSEWYYAEGGETKGPFVTRDLATKFDEGEIDGMTMLYGQVAGWVGK